MDTPITFRDAVVKALKDVSEYNRNDMVAPVAVLWTDKDHQWEQTIQVLKNHLPILTLGDYAPEERIGPAYYLRCMIARTLNEDQIPEDETPIIYLPGVSKQEIRAIEECPIELQPLAELQYRGVLWVQRNGRDWTVPAFIQTSSGGLGIELTADQATKDALQRALMRLLDEPIHKIKAAAPLRSSYFDALLTEDEHRNILLWLDSPADYQHKISKDEWQAFCNICRTKYGFDPEKDGPISASQKIPAGDGDWKVVWGRFKEAPTNYRGIPDLLKRAGPKQVGFEKVEFWPQDNEAAEEELLSELSGLESTDAIAARNRIIELERTHSSRRDWVWASLGQAPLAGALQNLANVALYTNQTLAGDDVRTMVEAYREWGWQVDAQVIKSIQKVKKQEHVDAVLIAIQVIYEPWLRSAAEQFQKTISNGSYPHKYLPIPNKGICILFTDALRMDVGQMLAAEMSQRKFSCDLEYHLAALPTITATAKYAFFDMENEITGNDCQKLTPRIQEKKSLISAQAYRDLLADRGFQILSNGDLGDPSGIAWTEIGEIDVYGHQHSWKIAHHIIDEIKIIADHIEALLNFGWKNVVVVTDHGWLFLPGGLTKSDLPEHITEIRKGRCSELKPGAQTEFMQVPWFWNKDVAVAIAPGTSCFEAGKDYEHGGISVQECVTPMIVISKDKDKDSGEIFIVNQNWRGLRLTAEIENVSSDIIVDIRLKAGDPNSSVIAGPSSVDQSGNVSMLVEDDNYLDRNAFIVVMNSQGQLICQEETIIGE